MKRQLRTDTIYLIRLVCIVFLTERCVVVVFFFIWQIKKNKVGEKRGCFTDEPIGQGTNRKQFLCMQKDAWLQFKGLTLCTFHRRTYIVILVSPLFAASCKI